MPFSFLHVVNLHLSLLSDEYDSESHSSVDSEVEEEKFEIGRAIHVQVSNVVDFTLLFVHKMSMFFSS